jgi:hypothetical protein
MMEEQISATVDTPVAAGARRVNVGVAVEAEGVEAALAGEAVAVVAAAVAAFKLDLFASVNLATENPFHRTAAVF